MGAIVFGGAVAFLIGGAAAAAWAVVVLCVIGLFAVALSA